MFSCSKHEIDINITNSNQCKEEQIQWQSEIYKTFDPKLTRTPINNLAQSKHLGNSSNSTVELLQVGEYLSGKEKFAVLRIELFTKSRLLFRFTVMNESTVRVPLSVGI